MKSSWFSSTTKKILKEVEKLSGGRVTLGTGTLYGALQRLLQVQWIRRVEDPIPNSTDRERKAYALTQQGRRVLNAETERLQNLVAAAKMYTAEDTP